MNSRVFLFILTAGLSSTALALNGTEKTHIERSFECILSRGEDGVVWVREPHVTLGMISIMAGAPVFRLSPALAEKYAPLVTERPRVRDDGTRIEYFLLSFPRVEEGCDPVIYVSLEARGRLAKGAPLGIMPGYPFDFPEKRRTPERVIEITSARVLSAERISREWQTAWERLHQTLHDIAAETLEAPGEEKRKRLAALIERGAGDLDTMMHPKADPDWTTRVREIDPGAGVRFPFETRIAQEWGRTLSLCIECLGIRPGTPLPPLGNWDTARSILAESDSKEGFVSGMKKAFGENAMEQRVFHPFNVGRQVYAWQIAEGSPELYEKFRARARYLSREGRWASEELQRELRGKSAVIDEFGLSVRPLDDELMAEKMVLGGILVEDVLPQGKRLGFQPGDVIVTVKSTYELLMNGSYGLWVGNSEEEYVKSMRRSVRGILNRDMTAPGENALIIRGDEIVTMNE